MLVIVILVLVLVIALIAFFLFVNADSDGYCIEIAQKSNELPGLQKVKEAIKAAWGVEPGGDPSAEVAVKPVPSDDGTTQRFLIKYKKSGYGLSFDPKPYPFGTPPAHQEIDPVTAKVMRLTTSFWQLRIIDPKGKPTEDDAKNAAQLVKQLVDQNTLAIFSERYGTFNPMTDELRTTLAGNNPQAAFTTQIFSPMHKISAAEIAKMHEQAQKSFHEFASAFEKKLPEDSKFSIKLRIEDKNGAEHVWAGVAAIKGDTVEAKIDNNPEIATSYKIGQKITVKTSDIEDWLYVHGQTPMGGFSLRGLNTPQH